MFGGEEKRGKKSTSGFHARKCHLLLNMRTFEGHTSFQTSDPQPNPRARNRSLQRWRGQARRRFERWRANTPLVEERCRFWEDNLMQLAKGLRPVRPPRHVWQGIRARLNLAARPRPCRIVLATM